MVNTELQTTFIGLTKLTFRYYGKTKRILQNKKTRGKKKYNSIDVAAINTIHFSSSQWLFARCGL